MEICRIPTTWSLDEAKHHLERLARGGIFSWRRWTRRHANRVRVVSVWLPCRQVRFDALDDGSKGFILVNGFSRQASLMVSSPGERAACAKDEDFSYALSDEETLAIARRAFLDWRLNRTARTTRDSKDFVVGGLWFYPFWVRMAEERHGRISLELLDGVTGRPAGLNLKQAYLDALRQKETTTQ